MTPQLIGWLMIVQFTVCCFFAELKFKAMHLFVAGALSGIALTFGLMVVIR